MPNFIIEFEFFNLIFFSFKKFSKNFFDFIFIILGFSAPSSRLIGTFFYIFLLNLIFKILLFPSKIGHLFNEYPLLLYKII